MRRWANVIGVIEKKQAKDGFRGKAEGMMAAWRNTVRASGKGRARIKAAGPAETAAAFFVIRI
jgi:hypothetical protein